jgi:hypothetical protein
MKAPSVKPVRCAIWRYVHHKEQDRCAPKDERYTDECSQFRCAAGSLVVLGHRVPVFSSGPKVQRAALSSAAQAV